jgi:DNA-binding NarL/FixJ family response regulator
VNDNDMKSLLQETQWVRKLLVLQLLLSGCKQKQIAAALGVSNATMSRMVPKGFAKELIAGRAGV